MRRSAAPSQLHQLKRPKLCIQDTDENIDCIPQQGPDSSCISGITFGRRDHRSGASTFSQLHRNGKQPQEVAGLAPVLPAPGSLHAATQQIDAVIQQFKVNYLHP
jgi:hypothetical protein